jgi:hypothetical protein
VPLNDEAARILRGMPDETVGRPLWTFPPHDRLAVLSERAKRHILQIDPEPIGDPEYN